MARKLWEKRGLLLPDVLKRITPSQFVAIFTRPPGAGGFDRVESLRRHNDERATRGLRPTIPSWL